MEKSTPIGLIVGFGLIYGAIFLGEGWTTFFDPASLLLVLGGTAAALCLTFSFAELKQVPGGVKAFFSFQPPDLAGYVEQFSELSRVARREGLLALDRRLQELDDAYLRFGLEMAVDGIEEEAVEKLMMRRLREEMSGFQLMIKVFTSAGTYAPAFGMIGTLIGLIQMLQNLTDPDAIGPAMAVALITTFYGALLANMVFLPIASKMRTQMNQVLKAREMVRTGVLAIMQGDGPTMIEKQLRLYAGTDDDDAVVVEPEADSPLSRAA